MTILILNWRDPANPRSGGAEAVTYTYARHWCSLGHQVYWLANYFPGAKLAQTDSGINFIRIKPALGFTFWGLIFTYPVFLFNAIVRARQLLQTLSVDLVIDQIHGLPFFSPLYSKSRNVLLVCEVAGKIWDKMFPFPVNLIGKFLEQAFYKLYRRTETWAISKHTKKDIYAINANPDIRVLPLGIHPPPLADSKKFSTPSAVFLGRLVKMKGVESAIFAAKAISQSLPDYCLYIAGSADAQYLASLQSMVADLGIKAHVKFLGFVTPAQKYALLAASHFLIHPSYNEGFGLTVLEAAALGTPTLGRVASGLDELITNGVTGYLFTTDNQIAGLFTKNFSSPAYQLMCTACKRSVKRYFWTAVLARSRQVTRI